jgi:hypothetical protein
MKTVAELSGLALQHQNIMEAPKTAQAQIHLTPRPTQ